MGTLYLRLLDGTTLVDGDAQDLTAAQDLAGYRELEIVVRVTQAGEGDAPRLIVEHSPGNESATYLAFSDPVEVDLTATSITWFHQGAFTRWVRWRVDGTLSTSAVVTVEIVGKG